MYPHIKPAICLAIALGFSNTSYALVDAPIEILDFAAQNGLILQKAKPIPANKYPLAGKTVNLSGKLSISGSASYMGRNFPFSAPGDKRTIQHVSYIFGQPLPDGSLPFKLNHPYGEFDGIMTAVKPDKYQLRMSNPNGSMLSSLVHIAQSASNAWKSTGYGYTAVATQKKIKGVATIYLEVKEKASFRLSIPGMTGAVANYTYSLNFKSAVE